MSLDLGALVATIDVISAPGERKIAAFQARMQAFGAETGKSTAQIDALDEGLAAVAATSTTASSGLTRAGLALRGVGLSASETRRVLAETTVATQGSVDVTTEYGLAQSRAAQATLRQAAALARLNALQESGKATTAQLTAAQAAYIAASDRVVLAQERVAETGALSARGSAAFLGALAAIPGPAKAAAVAIALVVGAGSDLASKFQADTKRIQTQAGDSAAEVQTLSRGILAMAGSVATTPKALADAAYHIASMGQNSLTTAQQLNVLRIAAEGAKVGNANLTDVTNGLDAAIASGIKGTQDYSHAMGVLNATVGAGDMTMQDLADALGTRILTSARAAGLSLTDVGAALAVFGDLNQRGSMAATRFAQAITLMQAPTDKAKGALKELNIGADELGNDMRKPQGLLVALQDLQAHLTASGKNATQQAQVISAAFGGSRTAGSVMLLLQQLTRLEGKYGDIDSKAKTFSQDWDAYTKTFAYAADRVKAEAESLAIEVGNKSLPALTKAVGWLGTTGIDDLGRFGHALANNAQASAGLHDLEQALGHIGSAIENQLVAIEPFAKALAAIGGGVALSAFQALAAVLDETAGALDDVTGFFAENKVAADALAVVLSAALVPALLGTVTSLAEMIAINGAAMFISMRAAVLEAAAALTAADGGIAGFGLALEALNINPVVAGVTALTVAATGLALWLSRVHDDYDSVGASGQKFVESLNDQHTSSVASTAAVGGLVATLRALQSQHTSSAAAALVLQIKTKAVSAAIAEQGAVASNERSNVAALAAEYGITTVKVDALAQAHGVVLYGALSKVGPAFDAIVGPTLKLSGAEVALKGAAQGSDAAIQALSVTLAGLVGDTISADQQQNAFASGLRQLKKDIDASHGSMSRLSAAGTTARDSFDSLIGTVLQSAAANEKLHDGGDRARAVLLKQIDALKALGSNSPYVIAEIKALTKALHQIPAETAGETAGRNYVAGLVKGLEDNGALAAAAQSDAALIISATTGPSGLHTGSPSKKAIQFGKWYGEGLAVGILSTQAMVAEASAIVARAITSATTPEITDPVRLQAMLGSASKKAIAAQGPASAAHDTYKDLKAQSDAYDKASKSAAWAAKQAHELATAMTSGTKVEAAAKKAAEQHAEALSKLAGAASHTATEADNAASHAQKVWQKLQSAADKATQKAVADATQIVSVLQSQLDQMQQAIGDFESSVASGLTGDYSLSTVWGALVDSQTQAASDLATAQSNLASAQDAVTAAGAAATTDQLQQLADAKDAVTKAQAVADQANSAASVTGLQSSLSQVMASAQKFAGDLQTLVGDGASSTLIQQLVAMGPQAGDALASQLVAAGSTSVGQLSSTLDAIASYAQSEADSFGSQFADALSAPFYPGGVSAMDNFIKGLIQEFPALTSALTPLMTTLDGILGISSTVTAAGHGGSAGSMGAGKPASPAFIASSMVASPIVLPALTFPTVSSMAVQGGDGASQVTAVLDADSAALLQKVAAAMESRPVQLVVDQNGKKVIGQISNDERQAQRLVGNPDFR